MNYLLLVIDMDDYSQRSRYWSKEDRELWNFAVKNVLSSTFHEDELTYSVLQVREGEWSILIEQLSDSSVIDTEILNEWSNQIKGCVKTNLNLGISVGIYQQAVSITHLSGAYKKIQCELHLNASKKASDTRIIYDKTANKNEIDYSIWNLIEEIVTGLKQCDQENTNQALNNLNLTLQALSEQSLVRVEQILHFLIIHLVREMREMQFVTVEQEEALWGKLEFCLGIKDLMNIIIQLIDSGMESAFKKKTSEMMMISAKDYIDRKINSDIAVEEVAVHLGISNSYFSLLFKQYYGKTFVEYVTKQRMESAKSLLRMSDKSITQIGKQVGYAERRYFTKVFQKYTGVKPSAFREMRNSEECK